MEGVGGGSQLLYLRKMFRVMLLPIEDQHVCGKICFWLAGEPNLKHCSLTKCKIFILTLSFRSILFRLYGQELVTS